MQTVDFNLIFIKNINNKKNLAYKNFKVSVLKNNLIISASSFISNQLLT